MVSEGESVAIMAGSLAAGRQPLCYRRNLKHKHWDRDNLNGVIEASKYALSDTPPRRPHLLILNKRFHQMQAKYSDYESIGGIPIQTTTDPD